MSGVAFAFLAGSWAFVLGLTAWSFRRILRASEKKKRSGGGNAPPEPPR